MSQRKPFSRKRQKSLLQETPSSTKFLGQTSLRLYQTDEVPSYSRGLVPPSSPKEVFFEYTVNSLPDTFPKLKDLRLPRVRMIGVKASIEMFAQLFKCYEFKLNLLQFWFLDMLTDCLWRAQDEYQFPETQQKIILEWVLYFFKLIRASNMNMSRNQIFRIFKEAISLAENCIEAGVEIIPLPDQLFTLNIEALEHSVGDRFSTTSLELMEKEEEFLVICRANEAEIYKIPDSLGIWEDEDECLSTSVETISEIGNEDETSEPDKADPGAISSTESDEDYNFYKPDMSTPPRFKSSKIMFGESDSLSTPEADEPDQSSNESAGDAAWKLVPRKLPRVPCPSRVLEHDSDAEEYQPTEKELEESALQAWYEYHLWQLRKDDVEQQNRLTEEYSDEVSQKTLLQESVQIQNEFINLLRDKTEERKKTAEDMFVNSCVLLAIKEFVLDYFYESFQFDLIRIAYRTQHHLITQELTKEWHIPKLFKGELKRPQSKKKKKESAQPVKQKKEATEVPKEETEKKGKKGKKGEKSEKKTSPKKSTKPSKSTENVNGEVEKVEEEKKIGKGKEDKTSKAKESEKVDKKPKVDKKSENIRNKPSGTALVEMTEEVQKTKTDKSPSKSRIDKPTKDQKLRDAEENAKEENRKYIFPLNKAVDDEFFREIFSDWSREHRKPTETSISALTDIEDASKLDIEKKKNKKRDGKTERGRKKGKK